MMHINKKNTSGFTLIELLVVIAVIGIISGVVLQSLSSARIKSRDAARLATIDQLQKAFEVSATVKETNQLPHSTGYVCLGSIALPLCGGVADSNINNPLSAAIANNVVPYDPKFTTNVGANYLYNSNITPLTTPVSTAGAYLSWVMEGGPTCGRGVPGQSNPITNGTQCFLRIGNAI